MYLLMIIGAAISFVSGSICMKFSEGLSKRLPTLLSYIFFVLGASLENRALQKADLSVTYLFVVSVETILAFLLSIILFKERHSFLQLLGLSLMVVGIILSNTQSKYSL